MVDLRDAYERATAARGQLDELAVRVQDYLDTEPMEFEPESTGGIVNRVQGQLVREAPARLWLEASSAMHHLRAALDNAVHQIAVQSGGPQVDRIRQFPVSLKQEVYWGVGGKAGLRERCLKHVPEQYRRVVDSVQPFQHGRSAEQSSLRILTEFDNGDKHREANRAYSLVLGIDLQVRVDGVPAVAEYAPLRNGLMLSSGGHTVSVGPLGLQPGVPQPHVAAASVRRLDVGVRFGRQGWQVADFYRLADAVHNTLVRLAAIGP